MDSLAKKQIPGGAEISTEKAGLSIRVRGTVQGVGFRPFIFTLAQRYELTGTVANTSSGVDIEVDGTPNDLELFLAAIRNELPPLAKIDEFTYNHRALHGYAQFKIISSLSNATDFQPVPADIALCADCRRELFDPTDRRFRYPFINCTNCGPRFSIIYDLPYDRPLTSMADFPLCDNCRREYHDPSNRRFHAQPVACQVCGPQIRLEIHRQASARGETALRQAREMLAAGRILAVKGLGGFHLACNAEDPIAVQTLRARKKRSDKPFALMAFDVDAVQQHCHVDGDQATLLRSHQAPIVLLDRLARSTVSTEAAPGQNLLGFMLAYTPLHLLLLEPSPSFPTAFVMTSGNLSEEPIAYRDEDANTRLTPLADAFLVHDRPIHIRVDDTVVAPLGHKQFFIRRSRGYAPSPIGLPFESPALIATGSELKNTFCLARGKYAFVSHHIGDMENFETLQSYETGIKHYENLFRVKPSLIACDLHPDYLATRYAQDRAARENIPLLHIQHHHAHLASCLADNGWDKPERVIGIIFDGTGYGTDGAIWGGEILLGNYAEINRLYHLTYVPLPGGDLAVRKPARMALAHLRSAEIEWDSDLPPVAELCADERILINTQIARKINSPPTSSMGRLFDAVASLIGIRSTSTYEAQAAIELEAVAASKEQDFYSFELRDHLIDPAPLLHALIADWRSGVSVDILSARFHNSVVRLVLEICQRLRTSENISEVALSGGVWQNRFLLGRSIDILEAHGFNVLYHQSVPSNDGGISLGQAAIAAKSSYRY
jgi:hydrogenase maturation protein HypF